MQDKKGVVFKHMSLEDELLSLEEEPVFVNELPLDTEEQQRFLESLTVTTYSSSDVILTTPHCQCKKHIGGHKVGVKCEVCNFVVTSPILREIKADLWIAAPAPIGFLFTPLSWIMFSKPLTSRQFNGLAWMCNPRMPTPDESGRQNSKVAMIIKQFNALGIPRGIKSVIENFDVILHQVILKNIVQMNKKTELMLFCEKYRASIFTRVLPLPSKVAMIVEKTSVGNYYDKTMDLAAEAAFAAADTASEQNLEKLESRFTSVMTNLGNYYVEAVVNILTAKKGWLRRVVYGNRLNFSYRDIITSYHEPHEYDTIKIPYHQLLSVMQPFVVKELIKEHGFNIRDAYDYVLDHAKDRDPFLWAILEKFIDDTPPLDPALVSPVERDLPSTLTTRERKGRGIVTTLTRFPSLDRGSTQTLRIVGMTEHDIQISVIAIRGPNADFDGDMMTGVIIHDLNVAENFDLMSPHYNIHSTADPGKLRHIMNLPAPTVQNISNFIESEVMVI